MRVSMTSGNFRVRTTSGFFLLILYPVMAWSEPQAITIQPFVASPTNRRPGAPEQSPLTLLIRRHDAIEPAEIEAQLRRDP
jgi:hypothetical protein